MLGSLIFLGRGIPHSNPKVIVRMVLISVFDRPHFLVQVKYTTKWAAPLEDLSGYFRHRNVNRCSILEQQSIDAIQQLYGYLTFNETRYGVLSNLQHTWFFQHVETANCKGKTLQYFGPIDIDSTSLPSMLKAFVGIILLAEVRSSFHTSPTPGRYFDRSHPAILNCDAAILRRSHRPTVVAGSYKIFRLDPRLCYFDRTSVRHAPRGCCTLRATLARGVVAGALAGYDLKVFCKIIDLFQSRNSIDALKREVRNYATLQNLQGVVIPRVRGYYDALGTVEAPCS